MNQTRRLPLPPEQISAVTYSNKPTLGSRRTRYRFRSPRLSLASLLTVDLINKTEALRITYHWRASVQQFLQWKRNKYYIIWICVFSRRYPTYNTHAPYCRLWPVWLYRIFPHYLINGTIFKKSCWTQKMFWFTALSETFLSLRRTKRHMITNVYWPLCKVHVILIRL